MRELMAGSVEELDKAGAAIVGGHSIEGPRLIAGFTVLGNQLTDPKTKGMLAVGDQLILTKPIGSGILLAGLMQGKLPAQVFEPMLESMLLSNQIALPLLQEYGIQAMTDVTGFGLAGHLVEMLKASQLSAELRMDDVPVLAGTQDLVSDGVQSTLAPDNRIAAAKVELQLDDIDSDRFASLFDPQTCGGLLFGVKPEEVDQILEYLGENGFTHSRVIGDIVANREQPVLSIV
jgi:selenide,water dikinase